MPTIHWIFSHLDSPRSLKQRFLQLLSVMLYEWDMRSAEVFNALQLWSIAVSGITYLGTALSASLLVPLPFFVMLIAACAMSGMYQIIAFIQASTKHRYYASLTAFALLSAMVIIAFCTYPPVAVMFVADMLVMALTAWQNMIRWAFPDKMRSVTRAKAQTNACERELAATERTLQSLLRSKSEH